MHKCLDKLHIYILHLEYIVNKIYVYGQHAYNYCVFIL